MNSTEELHPGRIAVFVDYMNVYKRARECFHLPGAVHWFGQFRPMRLGLKLAGAGDERRELVSVSVFRGQPSPERDPKGARAFDRQLHAWSQEGLTRAVTRPLNYRTGAPREKGVDVQLAVHAVAGAIRNEYDVAVFFTEDTDLLPALELVGEVKGAGSVEVAVWKPDDGPDRRLRLGDQGPWCHLLNRTDYGHVRDDTDFTLRGRRR